MSLKSSRSMIEWLLGMDPFVKICWFLLTTLTLELTHVNNIEPSEAEWYKSFYRLEEEFKGFVPKAFALRSSECSLSSYDELLPLTTVSFMKKKS